MTAHRYGIIVTQPTCIRHRVDQFGRQSRRLLRADDSGLGEGLYRQLCRRTLCARRLCPYVQPAKHASPTAMIHTSAPPASFPNKFCRGPLAPCGRATAPNAAIKAKPPTIRKTIPRAAYPIRAIQARSGSLLIVRFAPSKRIQRNAELWKTRTTRNFTAV
jgi:hypothetical protein